MRLYLTVLLSIFLVPVPAGAQTVAVITNNCSAVANLGQNNSGGTVYGDSTGAIVPPPSLGRDWNTAYQTYINAAWWFLLNEIPNDPNDPNDGISALFAEPYLNPGAPPTMAGYLEDNPSGRFSILSNSALYEYGLSQNTQVRQFCRYSFDLFFDTRLDAFQSALLAQYAVCRRRCRVVSNGLL